MTNRRHRRSRKWRRNFLFALDNLLLREGLYTRLSRRDRTLWVHESRGTPAIATVHDGAAVKMTASGGDAEPAAAIRRAAVNAAEIADALHRAKKQSVYYPDTRKDRMLVLASFGDYRLLCRKQRGLFTGFSFLVWETGTPALYRNIFHNYEEAKEQFAKEANIVDDWLEYTGVRALGCAIRFYLKNADEYRPYIMESLEKTDEYLRRLSNRGINGLYAYAYEGFDENLARCRAEKGDAPATTAE